MDAHIRRLHELIERALAHSDGLQELRGAVMSIEDPLRLGYLLASMLDIKAGRETAAARSRRPRQPS